MRSSGFRAWSQRVAQTPLTPLLSSLPYRCFYQDTTPKSTKQTIGMCYFRGMKFFIDTANLDQIREAEASAYWTE